MVIESVCMETVIAFVTSAHTKERDPEPSKKRYLEFIIVYAEMCWGYLVFR